MGSKKAGRSAASRQSSADRRDHPGRGRIPAAAARGPVGATATARVTAATVAVAAISTFVVGAASPGLARAQADGRGQVQAPLPDRPPSLSRTLPEPRPQPLSQSPSQTPSQPLPEPLTQPATRLFDIPAQSLFAALRAFSDQSSQQVLFDDEVVAGRNAPALQGRYTPQDALERLTAGTGLRVISSRDGVFTLRRPPPQSRTEQTLAPVVVSSRALRDGVTEGSGSYTAVTPTTGATRLGLTLRETPQSITVMTRERLDDQNITDLTEAMGQAPGVAVTTRGAYADTGYGIRGYAASLQRDGVSVGAEESYTLLPSVDLEVYDRIEIIRGPSGLLEGSGGSMGGVINLVRKRPRAEFGGTASVGLGSWNYVRTSASLNGALNDSGSVRGRAVVVNHGQEFAWSTAQAHRNLVYGIVEADLTPRTLLTISASDGRADRNPFYGLPPNGGGFPRDFYAGAAWNKVQVRRNFDGMAELAHELDNGWKLRGIAVYRRGESDGQMAMTSNLNWQTQRAARVFGYRFQREDETTGVELQVSGPFEALGRRHQIAAGALWGEVRSNVGGASRFWDDVDISNPANLPVDIRDFASVDDRRTETVTTQSALFGVARLKLLDPLSLVLGGRFSNYEQKSRGRGLLDSSDWKTSDARTRYQFTPYGGLVWDFAPNLSWYASYVDIFVPQTAKDWQQRTLDPRNGWQVETGIKGEFFEGRLNASLAVYRLRDRNRAMTDPDPAHMLCGENGDGFCSIAAGLQQSQGWELELTGNPTPNWNIAASYTRQDSRVLKTADQATIGKRFYNGAAPHMFRLWTTYRFDEQLLGGALGGWQVGGGIVAQSAQEQIDSFNNVRNPGYAIYSAQVGYRINRHVRTSLTIDNLFDRHYFSGMGYGQPAAGTGNRWFYGSPRSVMLSVRGEF